MGIPLIEGDDKKRARKCLQAIQEILNQYDCILIPRVTMPIMGPEDTTFVVRPLPRDPNAPKG